jgi:hypothetical protein
MLAETLLAWLETGKSSSVASRLFIHPQTARYRLHKLQDLFGDQLDNPDARFELALVLRARHSVPQRDPGDPLAAPRPAPTSPSPPASLAAGPRSAAPVRDRAYRRAPGSA